MNNPATTLRPQRAQHPQRAAHLLLLLCAALAWASSPTAEAETAPSPSAKLTKAQVEGEVLHLITNRWSGGFEPIHYPQQRLDHVVDVAPGESIQDAVDSAHQAGGGVVRLAAGTHVLDAPITLKSGITVTGHGQDQTIIQQGKHDQGGAFQATPDATVRDVVISHLTLDGTRSGRANGIYMAGRNEDRHARVTLQDITITNWNHHGVHIKRVDDIVMNRCTIQHNGAEGGYHHNVYFLYNKRILQSDCDMSHPVLGKGCKYTSVQHLIAQRCTIKGKLLGNGIQADNNEAGHLFFHKYHISGCARVAMWFPCENYYDKFTYTEDPTYAPQNVIINRCEIVDNQWGAMWRRVGNAHIINSTFDNHRIDVGALKSQIRFVNNTLGTIESYHDVSQWPKDVELLW